MVVGLVMAVAVLFCGNGQLCAQPPPDAQAKSEAKATVMEEQQKSAYQRRQEANKRLKEAIDERKARRLAGAGLAAPDKDGKGGAQ